MASQTINFITWNVNGLKQHKDQKFQELQNADVVFLQETHIGVGKENITEGLKNEWHVFYTKYTPFSKGTAILVRKRLDFECISDEKDNCGAYVVLKCKLEGQLYTLVSVYNHEKDTKTLDNLSRYLQSMTTGLLVIGGDFNTVLNRFTDKKWITYKMIKNRTHSKLLSFVEKLTKSLQLVDVWRRKNPKKQDYTFHIKDCPVSRLDYFFVPEECMWRVSSCEIRHSKITDHHPVSLEINNIPAMPFQNDPQIQSIYQLLNHKNYLLTDETGSSLGEESSHAVSEVDIVSAVHSLQVSDTPRPDGIPVSFYKNNIQVIIPYIKTLYDRIHSGAFNCSETYFNESLKSSYNDSQHFFNVDYLIIATILARRLEDFLKPESKGMLKDSATIMITSKTLGTQTILCCLKDEMEQKLSNSTLYQDFLTVENLLRDAEDFSSQKDNLLCQGCPLTPILITSTLKCYTLKLCKNLNNYAIHVFKLSVIVCIPSEDLDKVNAMVNRTNEEYDIETLSSGKGHKPLHLSSVHDKTSGEDWDEVMEAAEQNCPQSDTESEVCEESDYGSNGHEEKDKSMESDGRTTMYAVVTLQDSDEVMVVASNWLSEDKNQCYWPPFKSPIKCLEAVQNRFEPSTGEKPWEKLAILFHAEYGTYEQAKEKQAAVSEQTEQPVKPKHQVIETSPLSSVPSQSALSGISSDGSLSQNIQPIIVSQGIKRKHESCDSHTSAKPHSDMFELKMAKQIMTEVKIRIQNINSTDRATAMLTSNILDAITTMDEMDKDNRRKETIGVFGKTGEGKSSLFNAILGIDYLLPSGSFGACTSAVTQVEANLADSNYIAEIELISKEQWEDEIALTDKSIGTVKERITAVYGQGADMKTVEELKKDDKYAEIETVLSTKTKTISHSKVSEFSRDVARYIQHSESSPGGWYWPLVKSVKIKIPNCQELLEHIVLVDIPGTGDCNKIRDDMWKSTLRECSSVWIVSGIKRAITETDPWGILKHCIQDLGPGGECKNINFICTRTDNINPTEYLRSLGHSGDQISLDKNLKTECILHRNKCAKENVKKKFENLEIMNLKARFITDVFTVSSKGYLDKNPHLDPIKTEIPKLQDVLKNTNRSINRQLTRDYINKAKGVLSLIQSVQLDTDVNMAEIKYIVHKDLEESLVKALNDLDHHFDSSYKILDECLTKGVEESVELCVKTTKSMMASVAPDDKRGFHKTLQALYKNKGCYWPKNWDAPLDLNMILAKHMHDNIDKEFNSIFPNDANIKTGISVQEQIAKFSIIQSGTDYLPSSMLYHMENFIKTEETRVKAALKREVVYRKKEIYSSIQTTIQNQMTTGYEQAAKLKGNKAMEKRENIIMATIELEKYNMYKNAQMKVLNEFMLLKCYICKTLENELKGSVERSFPQTSKTTLMDVSREINKLEKLSKQLSD